MKPLAISLIGIIAILLILTFVFAFKSIRKYKDLKLTNTFPYEVVGNYYKRNLLFLFTSYSLVSFIIIALVSNQVFMSNNSYISSLNGVSIVGSIAIFISLSSWIFLSLFGIEYTKEHIALFVINNISSILGCAIYSVVLFNLYRTATDAIFLILFIISSLLAVISLILILLPRVCEYANLIKKISEDNLITYHRPKVVLMASLEWLSLLTNSLIVIVILIAILAI